MMFRAFEGEAFNRTRKRGLKAHRLPSATLSLFLHLLEHRHGLDFAC